MALKDNNKFDPSYFNSLRYVQTTGNITDAVPNQGIVKEEVTETMTSIITGKLRNGHTINVRVEKSNDNYNVYLRTEQLGLEDIVQQEMSIYTLDVNAAKALRQTLEAAIRKLPTNINM